VWARFASGAGAGGWNALEEVGALHGGAILEHRPVACLGRVYDVEEYRNGLNCLTALFATDKDVALKDADLCWKRRDEKADGLARCHVVVSTFHAH
jgi:hypothetical protein